MRRSSVAIWLVPGFLACAGTPEPRPVLLDPSNPDAPPAERIELEAFASGPRSLDEPLLPDLPPEEEEHHHHEEPHEGHEHHHDEEAAP